MTVRVLCLADSHLGFDLPAQPRVARRRRGHDFLANHAAALAPAQRGEVDVVVHGGDVFDVPRVSPQLARLAYEPLLRAADAGVPVFIVPGNHERARLPHARFLAHPRVHVFDVPRTFAVTVRGVRVALSGFPYERRVRSVFPQLVGRTRWQETAADARLLCVHHCVEGATVGPGNFTFTSADDVIRRRDLPPVFAAVLSGHIHRHQVLQTHGTPPVLYPGSLERTSYAEIGEPKGCLHLELDAALRWSFRELPARPMVRATIAVQGRTPRELDHALRTLILAQPADAVLGIRIEGDVSPAHARVLTTAHVRSYAPASMNVELRAQQWVASPRQRRGHSTGAESPQLGLL